MAESRFDDWIAERYDVLWRNASAHLEPGGSFVIENYIPELRRGTQDVLVPAPLCLAVRAGPHGTTRRNGPAGALEQLAPRALHEREPQPRLRVAEADVERVSLDLRGAPGHLEWLEGEGWG